MENKNIKDLNEKIIEWAKERELDTKGTVDGQAIKTSEEIAELIKGISKGNLEMIKDSIGDVYVTLVIGNMLNIQLGLEEYYKKLEKSIKNIAENKKIEISCLLEMSRDILEHGYSEDELVYGIGNLMYLATIYNLDFIDCIENAYKEITGKKTKRKEDK